MNPEQPYPRHVPPPSRWDSAELLGTIEDIDVWWDPRDREYWYNLPDIADAWVDPGKEPWRTPLKPAFPLAEAHRLLTNP